jgi:hypothetical protein
MYTAVNLGITEAQLQQLLSGAKIFVERTQFKGNIPVPLNKAQAKLIATATRGVNLKLSGPQIKALIKGEGFLQDIAKAALPVARAGVNWGLDKTQAMIPTEQTGAFKPIADSAVQYGRKGVNWGLDKLQGKLTKMLGGAAGVAAMDAKYGEGWFKDYLLPGIETAAKIAVPILRGGGTMDHVRDACDEVHGEGWFKDYLLPGVETAAKIAVPLLRGRGFDTPPVDGEGFFSTLLGIASTVARTFGGGWEPMTKKKQGQGLRL